MVVIDKQLFRRLAAEKRAVASGVVATDVGSALSSMNPPRKASPCLDEVGDSLESAAREHALSERVVQTRVGPVKVLEDCQGVWAVGNGATVWDAGLLLADFLGMQDSLEGATALELGAGLGLVGMCLSKFGARVVLTDRPLALPLLRRNVAENCLDWGLAAVAVESLVFGETLPDWAEGGFDVVVASDVVFPANSECHGALIETLRAVVQPKTRCWLAYEPRAEATNTAFFNSLGQFFDVQRVPAPDLPENAPDDLWIFRLVSQVPVDGGL